MSYCDQTGSRRPHTKQDASVPDHAGGGSEPATDAELLHRLKSGDLEAFELLFERHRTAVFRTALAVTGDQQVAEEVMQDTFVRAYQRRASLEEGRSPLPWLHRVALNLCYTRVMRRKANWEPIDENVVRLVRDRTEQPEDQAERTELRQIVRDGVLALPERHQAVVVLYYLHGLSLQETAEILDVPVGTVKSRLHYALVSLRSRLEDDRRFGGAYRTSGVRGVEMPS